MSGLTDFRAKHPEYNDMPDDKLADSLYRKFYSDMPRDQFNQKMGAQQQVQQTKPPVSTLDQLKDVVGSFDSALVKSGTDALDLVSATLPGSGILRQGMDMVAPDLSKKISFSNLAQQGVNKVFGGYHQPQTTAGEYAKTLGEFAPALAVGPEGLLPRVANWAGPALVSEFAGQQTKGTDAEPWARLGSALVSSSALSAAERIPSLVARALSKTERAAADISPAQKRAADALMKRTTPDALEAMKAQLSQSTSKPLTLMDVSGPNSPIQRLARALHTVGDESSQKLAEFSKGRTLAQSDRVVSDIKQRLATNTDVYDIGDGLKKIRAEASRPLWDEAMNAKPNLTDYMEYALKQPEVQAGINRGITLARREAFSKNEPFNNAKFSIKAFTADGPVLESIPSWNLWQTAKEGLDAMVEDFRDPITHALPNTKDVNSLKAMRGALVGELKRANPKYDAALKVWAGPSEANDAMQMGRDFMRADPEEITKALSNLSAASHDFYKIGAARALQDTVKKVGDKGDVVQRIFGNPATREKVEAVFGKAVTNDFAKFAIGPEKKIAETDRFITGGSNTADKLSDLNSLSPAGEMATDFTGHILSGSGIRSAIARPAVKQILKMKMAGTDPETRAMLVDALTSSGDEAVAKLNKFLPAGMKQSAKRKMLADMLKQYAPLSALSLAPQEQQ